MPLYIRDPEVDRLVEEAQRLTNAPTKTETVKHALRKEIAAAKADGELPLRERIAQVQERAAALLGGPPDPNFNMKAFMDEMWGDL
jgi:antitoxin VapB